MRKTKIAVPIMPISIAEIENFDLKSFQKADIIEWRIDFMPQNLIFEAAALIFKKFDMFQILLTIRTAKEGGALEISNQHYVHILKELLKYNPDFIDVEYFSYPKALAELSEVKDKIVLSYHNFSEMPTDLTQRLLRMNKEKTAFVKVAVMPQRECDVIDLLQITRDLTLEYGRKFITIAMSDLGKLTRVSGYITGSCWTFASVLEASAPGQIELDDMSRLLDLFENEA
ncbi:type I 3-dehydroquinate dehydratase [Lactococcus hircilactis]|uniref:3-dehydroquinate dehydratase n=1 Tax=Lactococcus hircilactis TaxID=1494462 RepID=A0A7X2D2F9_9LACT|nr:type I 3-dehydroquinate dehydratase [Lactococcus hircilactis]MQW40030.1 type I 3-dehydroquinate dehydratase [Lactococcus hircilactis]